jgi:glucose/arabinose dehydrogenase
MKFISAYILLIILLIACSEQTAQTELINAFPNLSFYQPVDIQTPNDGSNRLFVISQQGEIFVFDNFSTVTEANVFLDIRSLVITGGEQGLLGLAFHPNYNSNGYFYIDYTASNPRRTVISRFSVSVDDPQKADIDSELILLEVEQPYSNHNGGQLSFGPDGYLYISFGDGGSGGDPLNNGQNLSTILGSIIRIDVDNPQDGKNYSIPPDNPFNWPGAPLDYKKEIYAFGLRNVWRFSFDDSGNLWAADVGQNEWEEVNIIESGGNYGWRVMEGFHCYNPSSGCDTTGLILPIHEYGHNSAGGYSITGGYVYSGTKAPEYTGRYIYADYITGNIWALQYNGSVQSNVLIKSTDYNISTFGIDEADELYFADYSGGGIYKFNSNATSSSSPLVREFDFKLEQNYPNPFNPLTTIEYSLPAYSELAFSESVNSRQYLVGSKKHQSFNHSINKSNSNLVSVQLKVYDILGREVSTLVNDYQSPGNYSVNFNAGNLTSGIYYYRLTSGIFSEYKKMLLLK